MLRTSAKRVDALLVCIVTMLATAACGDNVMVSAGTPGGAAGAGGSSTIDGGGGTSGGDAFVEPNLPCLLEEPRASDAKISQRIVPDPAASCGEWAGTYWVTDDEEMVFEFDVKLGDRFDGSYAAGTLVFLLDGLAVPARFDGDMKDEHRFVLVPGSAATRNVRVEVPTKALEPGGHSAILLALYDVNHQQLIGAMGKSFAVMANGTHFADADLSDVPQAPGPGFRELILEDAGTNERLPGVVPYQDAGSRRLRLLFPALRGTAAEESPTLLLAFLDGEQVPLGKYGLRPVFRAQRDHVASLEWDQQLPTTPGEQNLVIIAQNAFWQPAEDEYGEPLLDFPRVSVVHRIKLEGPPKAD